MAICIIIYHLYQFFSVLAAALIDKPNVLWSGETKLFSQLFNNIQGSQSELFRPKNTLQTVKHDID